MTVEQTNHQEGKDEKKAVEPTPLEKEEIEALKAYAMGMFDFISVPPVMLLRRSIRRVM
jgi:hypothetical protein